MSQGRKLCRSCRLLYVVFHTHEIIMLAEKLKLRYNVAEKRFIPVISEQHSPPVLHFYCLSHKFPFTNCGPVSKQIRVVATALVHWSRKLPILATVWRCMVQCDCWCFRVAKQSYLAKQILWFVQHSSSLNLASVAYRDNARVRKHQDIS